MQILICRAKAAPKAFPRWGRWHGEAVTDEVLPDVALRAYDAIDVLPATRTSSVFRLKRKRFHRNPPGVYRPVLAVTPKGRLAKRSCSPPDCFRALEPFPTGEGYFWTLRHLPAKSLFAFSPHLW